MGTSIEQRVTEARSGDVVEISFEAPPSLNIMTLVGYFREYWVSPKPGTCRLAYSDADKESREIGIFVDTEVERFGTVVQEGKPSLYIPIESIKDFSVLREQ